MKLRLKDILAIFFGIIGAIILVNILFGLIRLTSGLIYVLAVIFVGIWVVNFLKRKFNC